ncbi:hypothetical protein HYALB_00006161 [Hymenoscyphus albidus]|uniref:Uncharacterized protein n=1 Tax=Hymenoscyphus albidus TaxID=595503 RepID=A0A9N9LIE3_9HELO|nr:hypothetical protein HYALB_00006161 [Hymenoscyphus albidus]
MGRGTPADINSTASENAQETVDSSKPASANTFPTDTENEEHINTFVKESMDASLIVATSGNIEMTSSKAVYIEKVGN